MYYHQNPYMRNTIFVLLTLAVNFLFSSCAVSCMQSKPGSVTESLKVRDAEQLVTLGAGEGTEFIVADTIDLHGGNAKLPANVLLTFRRGGAIVNGTLTGNGTGINAKGENVLGVKLKGSWCVDVIYDMAFSRQYLNDRDIIENLNVIQSDSVRNEVFITRDYTVTIPHASGSGLRPSSNSTFHITGDLTVAPNDYKSYGVIEINKKENVSIKGGRIIGDCAEHDYIEGSSSEWGMGLNIKESRNVIVENLYITRCTGDGIYISGGNEPSVGIYDFASKNITIKNVVCDDNRRQGMSIIHVDGLIVRDCSFINTGATMSTPPSAGIDIEPNVSNGRNMSVRNVVVDNCTVTGNKGSAIATNNTYEADGLRNYANILFSNCRTDGLLKAQSDDMTFRNCTFKEIRFAAVYAPTHITMEDCTISGGYGITLYVPTEKGVQSKDRLLALDFRGCTISTIEEETRTKALISCYKSYVPNLEYVRMENCHLMIPKSKAAPYYLTDYDFKGKLHISASTIDMQGVELKADGVVLDGNRILCAKVFKSPEGSRNKITSIEQ